MGDDQTEFLHQLQAERLHRLIRPAFLYQP